VLQIAKTTCIYWWIKCTPKPWFVVLLQVPRITHIY
jgi:hypothetical protein